MTDDVPLQGAFPRQTDKCPIDNLRQNKRSLSRHALTARGKRARARRADGLRALPARKWGQSVLTAALPYRLAGIRPCAGAVRIAMQLITARLPRFNTAPSANAGP